jgi:hypothetical protein
VAHRNSFLSLRALAGIAGTAVRNAAATNDSACLLDGEEGGMVEEEDACVERGHDFSLVKVIEAVGDHIDIKVPTSSAA